MKRLPFHQIDAFADRPFTGNPAAVMPLDAWLDDATLLAIAAENNLAETAFIVATPGGIADYDLRWFTPAIEVALCGHATLASGHFALQAEPARKSVTFATRNAGILSVERDDAGYLLGLPAWPAEVRVTGAHRDAVAAALGAESIEVWARGNDYLVAIFAQAAEVRALAPDFRAVIALQAGADLLMIVSAPGTGDPSGADVVSRAFAPEAGIDEDPVTGSAHAILAPYWANRFGRTAFTAYQASKRGGHLGCRVAGDRVLLSGRCVTVIEAVLLLP